MSDQINNTTAQLNPALAATPAPDLSGDRSAHSLTPPGEKEQLLARTQELLEYIGHWNTVHRHWAENGLPEAKDPPPEEWGQAARAVVEAFTEGDLPSAVRDITQLILGPMQDALLKWDEVKNPMPPGVLFKIREQINANTATALNTAKFPPRRESARHLSAHGVSIRQIAEMIFGTPHDHAKAYDELDEPGKWTRQPDYVHPQERTWRKEYASMQQAASRNLRVVRERIRIQKDLAAQSAALPNFAGPGGVAWEPVDHLYRSGTSVQQIGIMKGLSIPEVIDELKRCGLQVEPPTELTDRDRLNVLRHLHSGKTSQEITKLMGFDGRSVYGIVKWAVNNPLEAAREIGVHEFNTPRVQ